MYSEKLNFLLLLQEQSRHAREVEVIKKEKEEETFADMRRSIQMMTHTSIILAGGLKRQPPTDGSDAPEDGVIIEEENSGSDTNNNGTPEQKQKNTHHSNNNYSNNNNKKGFKERIQNKLAFTFQRPPPPYPAETSSLEQDNRFSGNSSMVTTPDRDMGVKGGNDFDAPVHERTPLNGNVSMGRALPEINIDSPPPLISSRGGSFDSRPPSIIGRFDNNYPLPPPTTTPSSSGGVITSSCGGGGCGGGNKITKANKGEAVWFIENHEQQNKESSI